MQHLGFIETITKDYIRVDKIVGLLNVENEGKETDVIIEGQEDHVRIQGSSEKNFKSMVEVAKLLPGFPHYSIK